MNYLSLNVLSVNRVRVVKNEMGRSVTQQELKGWGSQWNEQGNWGGDTPPNPPSIRTLSVNVLSWNPFTAYIPILCITYSPIYLLNSFKHRIIIITEKNNVTYSGSLV